MISSKLNEETYAPNLRRSNEAFDVALCDASWAVSYSTVRLQNLMHMSKSSFSLPVQTLQNDFSRKLRKLFCR